MRSTSLVSRVSTLAGSHGAGCRRTARRGTAWSSGKRGAGRARPARAALLVAALTLVACAARTRAPEAEGPPPLRVGVQADYPPLCFSEDGEIKGIEPDLARLVGRELGRPVAFEVYPLRDLIPALLTEQIDVIMAGLSVTGERERQVFFTEPYARVGQMALIRKSDADRASDYARMNQPSSRVGVKRGSTGEAYARAHLGRAQIRSYASVGAGKAALRAGEIDYFIHDAPTIWRTVGRFDDDPDLTGMYRPLTAEYLAWAVRPSDAHGLGAEIEAARKRLEERGDIERVLDAWVPVRRIGAAP